MKSKKMLMGISIMVVGMAMALCGCQSETQAINVSASEDGIITVTAENAAKDSGGSAEITLESDSDVVKVDSELEEESSIEIIIRETENGKLHIQQALEGDKDTEFTVPAGEYTIEFLAAEGATGTMTVSVE